VDEAALLQAAASVESHSEHPLARAIVDHARRRAIAPLPSTGFRMDPGRGAQAVVQGRTVKVGSPSWVLGDGGAKCDPTSTSTVVAVAADGSALGEIELGDHLRPDARATIEALQRDGVGIVLCSGDRHAAVAAVARELAIADIRADSLPADKAAMVKDLRDRGHVVAMAGDGINDAPALASADVGIAMGTGTDIAIDAAGITLVRGDLRGIVRARMLSRATLTVIRQNLWFAFGYNAIAVMVAAGALYPVAGWLLSPMIASAAMGLSSLSVIANALRLRRVRL
jgi:P-type Cu+ transporter